jgi:hypothetical protein
VCYKRIVVLSLLIYIFYILKIHPFFYSHSRSLLSLPFPSILSQMDTSLQFCEDSGGTCFLLLKRLQLGGERRFLHILVFESQHRFREGRLLEFGLEDLLVCGLLELEELLEPLIKGCTYICNLKQTIT